MRGSLRIGRIGESISTFALLMFLFVVLHEFEHVVSARHYEIGTRNIEKGKLICLTHLPRADIFVVDRFGTTSTEQGA
jgi:hypothetical protein